MLQAKSLQRLLNELLQFLRMPALHMLLPVSLEYRVLPCHLSLHQVSCKHLIVYIPGGEVQNN